MFTQARVDTLLKRLDDQTQRGVLWIRASGAPLRFDFFSAMEPSAQALLEAGHGPGGDPVWMCALLDAGWPEWLVMLLLSLAYAKTDATDDVFAQLPDSVAGFSGGAEDAASYLFVRDCVSALATDHSSARLRSQYIRSRLHDGAHSVVHCLTQAQPDLPDCSGIIASCMSLSERLAADEPLSRAEFYALRGSLKAFRASDSSSEAIQPLLDFIESAAQIDDYTPLNSLHWPRHGPQTRWAPTDAELYQACRDSLRRALSS